MHEEEESRGSFDIYWPLTEPAKAKVGDDAEAP